MKSLRSRILAGMLIAVAFLLAAYGIVVYESARRGMQEEFDNALLAQASMLISTVEAEHEKGSVEIEIEIDTSRLSELMKNEDETYFQLWREGGEEIQRSAEGDMDDMERFFGKDEPEFRDMILPDGRPGRGVGIIFEPEMERDRHRGEHDDEDEDDENVREPIPPPAIILVLARNTEQMTEHLAGLRMILLIAGAAVVVIAVLLTALVVGRGLRPLNDVAGTISAIGAKDLDTRLTTEDMPTEIRPVAEKLNDMLQRLESAFYRERTLTADVAHELRTPIAGVRSTIEVALSRLRSPEDYQESLTDCLNIAIVMQSLVENLLMLARLDAGQVTSKSEEIDLRPLVHKCFSPLAERAADRKLMLNIELPDAISCNSDRQILEIVIANLLNNAISYADAGGTIDVSATQTDDDQIAISVSNSGCTLTADDAPLVFDRFWRGDAARANTGSHCGLGLSLVKQCMDFLGGNARVEIKDNTFTIHLSLPKQDQ